MLSPHAVSPGLSRTRLRCFWCEAERAPDLAATCTRCGGTLVAEVNGHALIPATATSLWDFAALLPVGDRLVSLGEGATPLLPLTTLYPDGRVFVKADWMNPTGSFKDRGASVAVSAALALGARGVICASTGNNGAAVSAYAARAGLPCIVVLPTGTPPGKIAQSRAAGSTVAAVPGTFSDAYRFAAQLADASGWANLTSTYINAYMTAAHASITYEIWGQLGGDIGSILMPIGAGPMLDGVMAGAERLRRVGAIKTLPVPVGVQAAGCAPIAEAFAADRERVTAWDRPCTTMAGSISDPLTGYQDDGSRTLHLIRKAGGKAVAVTDAAITQAMADLARLEGIAAEPAAVAPLAALRLLDQEEQGFLPRPVVLVVSGHALKDPAALQVDEAALIRVDNDTEPRALIGRAVRYHAEHADGMVWE